VWLVLVIIGVLITGLVPILVISAGAGVFGLSLLDTSLSARPGT
jgi:hypothetical protein